MAQYRPLSETKFINDANLVSYWKLDETSGTTAVDSKGSNNGTWTNFAYGTGKYGNAGSFTASTSRILIANESQFDFERTSSFTISCRAKLNSLTSTSFLWSKQLASGNFTGFSLYQNNTGKLEMGLANTASNAIIVNTPTLPDTTNYHNIIVTYNGNSNASGVSIYIDGKLQTNTVLNNTLTGSILNNIQLEIGNRDATFNMGGNIDDVAIFSRALTSTEVLELYQGMTYGEYLGAGSTTTKGLWHLNGNSSDSSGNGNNGTDTAITYSLANGKFGQGALFNGSNSYIDVNMSIPSYYTISAWFKTTNDGVLVAKDAVGGRSLLINTNTSSGRYYIEVWNSSGTNYLLFPTTSYISSGVRCYVTLVYDTNLCKLYHNGVIIGSVVTTGTSQNTANTLNIGRREYSGTNLWYAGTIDEVIIENVARSPEKIKRYYTYAKGRFGIV